jgi:hypothetical protein
LFEVPRQGWSYTQVLRQHEIKESKLRSRQKQTYDANYELGNVLPAFQRIHELSRRLQAFAHQMRLLPYHKQSIFQQARLVFYRRRAGHGEDSIVRMCSMAW